MKLDNAVVFITGANRGLGLAFAREALARGAKKVYAAARDPASVKLPGVQAIKLDVTSEAEIVAAAKACGDVTLLINNAGIADQGSFLAEGSVQAARKHLETNFFGPLMLGKAFAPVLAANGGGALLNVLSIASFINGPLLATYGASKSAAWALTNGLRGELREQKTQVLALHVAFMETDMASGIEAPKSAPEAVVKITFDALEAGKEEVMADDWTRMVKEGLSAEMASYLMPIPKRHGKTQPS